MSPALAVAARVVSWPPLLVAGLASTAMVAATLGGDAAFPMQAASILLASAVGYALDDPAADVLGPSPTSLLRRRGHRIVVALPPAAALWTVLLVWHGTGPAETLALVAMFAGLLGLALAVAGISVRRSTHGSGGMFVAPILLGLLLASTLFPPRWRPLPMGDIPGGWFAIDSRWFAGAAVGVAAFLLSSRDPAGDGRVSR